MIDGLDTISEQRRLEKQRDLFLATLLHDLKNPLQAQICTLEMLCKGNFGEVNDSQKEMLDMIIESNIYMKDMLCGLLNTYKECNGVIRLKRTNFSLNKMLENSIKEILLLAQDKNIRILYSPVECNIFADETLLRRVVENLLNNTVNYAFENSDISINIQNIKNMVKINFINQSPVIPEALEKSLFDKYTCNSDMTTHQGLGLYFCKKVIDAHGGKIYHTSKDNNNIFTVEMPVKKEKFKKYQKIIF